MKATQFMVRLGGHHSGRRALVTITALEDVDAGGQEGFPDGLWQPSVPDAHTVKEACERVLCGDFEKADGLQLTKEDAR